MPKDRFSNQKRSNYDKEFRYGNTTYTPKQKCNIVMTPATKKHIKQIMENSRHYLNSWEIDFLISLENRALISEKQEFYLDRVFDNVKERSRIKLVRG